MTQTASPAPVPASTAVSPPSGPPASPTGSVAATTPAGTVLTARVDRLRAAGHGTPGRMRVLSALLVVAGLLLSLGGAQAFRAAHDAMARADENAAQLVRLQEIRTQLVRADALATNAFLVGGIEPADQRSTYDRAISQAARLTAFAARAQPADGAALAALNEATQNYTGQIQVARANNRQGFPVGAQYLRDAGAGLRADALPLLQSLTTANEQRVSSEFGAARRAIAYLVVTGLLALLGAAAGLVWLARRTHRYLNLPMLAGGAVALVTLVAGAGLLLAVGGTVRDVRDGPYAQARALAEARVAAFDAKANESLTLISRGSGAGYQRKFAASAASVSEHLQDRPDLAAAWAAYTVQHGKIANLDADGRWDQAVQAATSRADGSANRAFSAFDTVSQTELNASSRATAHDLRGPRPALALAAVLAVLAGLAVAVLSWFGVAQRIEEYR